MAGDLIELALDCAADVRLAMVIDRVRALRFPDRLDGGAAAGLEPAAEGDRLYWIRPGGLDRVDGTVEAFEEAGVRFDSVLGSKRFPWEEVGALFVEPFAKRAKRPARQGVRWSWIWSTAAAWARA